MEKEEKRRNFSVCEECKKGFLSVRNTAKFCSEYHRLKHHRKKKKEAEWEVVKNIWNELMKQKR